MQGSHGGNKVTTLLDSPVGESAEGSLQGSEVRGRSEATEDHLQQLLEGKSILVGRGICRTCKKVCLVLCLCMQTIVLSIYSVPKA